MEDRVDIATLTKEEQKIILEFMRGKKKVDTEEMRKLMQIHLDKTNLFEYCIIIHNRDFFSIQRPMGL